MIETSSRMSSSSRRNSNPPLSRRFFKVMMPGFRQKLSIPLAFSKYITGEKSNGAVIKSPKGLWRVKISNCRDGQFYFEEGWSKFVEEHDLNIGEFVVFEHTGNLHFEALVYDYSSCEKEFPLPLDVDSDNGSIDEKIRFAHVPDSRKKRVKLDEINIAHVQESSQKRVKLDESKIGHVQESSKKRVKLDESKIDSWDKMFKHSKEIVYF